MTLRVGILRDHTGSMRSITAAAMKDYNSIIEELVSSADTNNIDIRVYTHECPNISTEYRDTPVKSVPKLRSYSAWGSHTPLFRDVNTLMNAIKRDMKADDTVLIMALTDGEDTHGHTNSSREFAKNCIDLQATDRWTITFRVPDKRSVQLLTSFGVQAGNIQIWETTEEGFAKSNVETVSSLRSYTSSVASGAYTSTTKFHANLDNVTQQQVKVNLRDISQEVLILPVSGAEGQQIRSFVENRIGRKMKKGAAFYQLMKTEPKVQDYKKIIIRDKLSNAIYEGAAARDLLGVPHNGDIKLAPGRHGNYDIFIQSTSVNRSLDKNSQVIYWENVGVDYKSNVPQISKPVATAPISTSAPQSFHVNSIIQSAVNQTKTVVNPVLHTPVHKVTSTKNETSPVKKTSAVLDAIAKATGKPVQKKRVRNRDTVQERIRRYLIANYKIKVKEVVNSAKMENLLGVNWRYNFPWEHYNKKFGCHLIPDAHNPSITVGDFINRTIGSTSKNIKN